MRPTAFKTYLKNPSKKSGAGAPAPSASRLAAVTENVPSEPAEGKDAPSRASDAIEPSSTTKGHPPASSIAPEGLLQQSGGSPGEVDLFSDADVCRVLRIRRRLLSEFRTHDTRGVAWDVRGLHAGMTRGWVERYAREHGIRADVGSLTPIRANDGVVTVRIVGRIQNPCVVVVERLADCVREIAEVRNTREHPLHNLEVINCMRGGNRLRWFAHLNDVKF